MVVTERHDDETRLSLGALNHRRAARAHLIAARLHEQLGHSEQAAEATERAEAASREYERAVAAVPQSSEPV